MPSGDLIYALEAFAATATALTLIYVLAGALARRGRHGDYARMPFTGGVQAPTGETRYSTDMVVFTGIFLLAEALALLIFLAPQSLTVALTLLSGFLLVFLPPLTARRGGRA